MPNDDGKSVQCEDGVNYCLKGRLGDLTIRGCGIPQFDPSIIGITSDSCKDNFSLDTQMNLGIVSGDTVFDRICACFSDNCNDKGNIYGGGKYFQAQF